MWMPPPDPEKPNCPYLPGFEVDISTHTAPPPFGGEYLNASYPFRTGEWMNSVCQSKHVVTFPPLETPAPTEPRTARLEVTKSLAIGNARGPQILLCSVTPYGKDENTTTFEAVAKIYDPLYYSFVSDIGSYPEDVVLRADSDYTQEATAYEHLTRAGQTGSFAPAYFGSWTYSLPVSYNGETHERSIRLILMEHLSGVCMKDLFVKNGPYQIDATHLSEPYRLKVLAMILDGAVKQRHVGLDQRDLAPRNVFLIPPPKLTRESTLELPRRVVLIDYNVSTVWELTKHGKRAVQRARLPPNPMKRFWTTTLSDLHGWAPKEISNPKCFQEWLCQEFGGEKRSLYEPILEELEFHEPPQDDLGGMHVSMEYHSMSPQSSTPIGSTPTVPASKKANVPVRTACGVPSGGTATSQPASGTPAPSKGKPATGPPRIATPPENLLTPAPQGGNARRSSPSKGPPKGEDEFEVVKAPMMLEGEKPAPTSGPLFDLVRARMKALELGQCVEKY